MEIQRRYLIGGAFVFILVANLVAPLNFVTVYLVSCLLVWFYATSLAEGEGGSYLPHVGEGGILLVGVEYVWSIQLFNRFLDLIADKIEEPVAASDSVVTTTESETTTTITTAPVVADLDIKLEEEEIKTHDDDNKFHLVG